MNKRTELGADLRLHIPRIVEQWEVKIRKLVDSAKHQEKTILRDEIPLFLEVVADTLEGKVVGGAAKKEDAKDPLQQVAAEHGTQRAETGQYSLDEAIYEYHILRVVLFQVLEEKRPIENLDKEVIFSLIEQAVQDMATQFAKSVQEARDLFVTTLVHDLRGPLNNASIGLHVLEHETDTKAVESAKEIVRKSLKRLDKMTRDLLDARKISAGHSLPLRCERFDIVELFQETIEDLSVSHRVVLEHVGTVEGFWCRDGLRRVADNLISNALKFGKIGAPVVVDIRQTDSFAVVSVHNQGNPIPAADHYAIFQPFFQSKSGPAKGWGVGLALVQEMISALGGSVNVDSSPESGTTFTVRLPQSASL